MQAPCSSPFLPQGTGSSTADDLLREKFTAVTPEPAGEAVLLVYNADGLSTADMQNAQALHDWLLSDSGPEYVEGVISVSESQVLSRVLVSTDNTAMVMKLDLSVGGLSADATVLTDQVRDYIDESCPGSTRTSVSPCSRRLTAPPS